MTGALAIWFRRVAEVAKATVPPMAALVQREDFEEVVVAVEVERVRMVEVRRVCPREWGANGWKGVGYLAWESWWEVCRLRFADWRNGRARDWWRAIDEATTRVVIPCCRDGWMGGRNGVLLVS